MHIITNLHFRISLNILQSNFIICVHKKNLHHIEPFILYKDNLHII
jgi:hypothetical protein